MARGFRKRLLPALAAPLLALGGCAGDADEALGVAVVGAPSSPFETGSRLPLAAQLVRAASIEGLVGFDEQGRVVPALAERWIVTDDRLSYIFRLREGKWPDGKPLSGETASAVLRKTLADMRGTPLAEELGGIRAIIPRTGRVVEIQLDRPNPNLLQLLAQAELGLGRNGRGTGPLRLRREKDVALLIPVSPESRGLPADPEWSVRIRRVRLQAMPSVRAIAAFDAGEADVVLGGSQANYPLARGVGIARASVVIDPVAGLFGLIVTREEGLLARPENREALAMAIDRDALSSAIDAEGWTPTTRVAAAGAEGDTGAVGERWAGESLAERQARAGERIARWRAGGAAPRLRIALPAGPGSDLVFDRLAKDFGAIGVETRRVGSEGEAELRLVDAVARQNHLAWYLGQLSCATRRGACSSTADVVAARAAAEPDAVKRADLYADAEAELTRANAYIPLGPPLRWSLLRRGASGFAANRWSIHPLIALATIPK